MVRLPTAPVAATATATAAAAALAPTRRLVPALRPRLLHLALRRRAAPTSLPASNYLAIRPLLLRQLWTQSPAPPVYAPVAPPVTVLPYTVGFGRRPWLDTIRWATSQTGLPRPLVPPPRADTLPRRWLMLSMAFVASLLVYEALVTRPLIDAMTQYLRSIPPDILKSMMPEEPESYFPIPFTVQDAERKRYDPQGADWRRFIELSKDRELMRKAIRACLFFLREENRVGCSKAWGFGLMC